RSLPARFAPAVSAVAAAVAPGALASCCASGACAFARSAVPSCRVFSVAAFPGLPPVAALRARSSACVRWVAASGSGAVVVFLASPGSVGSLAELREAAGLGGVCFAFACGFSPALLPPLGAGSWGAIVGGGVLAGAFRWVPSAEQPALFLF